MKEHWPQEYPWTTGQFVPNPEHLRQLQQGVDRWNAWRKDNPKVRPKLAGVRLKETNLENANLARADLRGAELTLANLRGADLSNANLQRAWLPGASLQKSSLEEADLKDAFLVAAEMQGSNLLFANCRNAQMLSVNLTGAQLAYANLTNASLREARIVDAHLEGVRFDSDHDSLHDESETIIHGRRNRLSWSRLRAIGDLPLFGVSYAALIASVVVVSWIGYVNDALPVWLDWLAVAGNRLEWSQAVGALTTPPRMPIPYRIGLTLIASLLLAAGATIYKLGCPHRIQEFSETQWVEQHGRARLQYLAESWRRRGLQWPALLFTAVGGLLATAVLLERVGRSLWYLWSYG